MAISSGDNIMKEQTFGKTIRQDFLETLMSTHLPNTVGNLAQQ